MSQPDPAKARFFMLSGLRLGAALLLLLGIAIFVGKVGGMHPAQSRLVGGIAIAIALFDLMVLAPMLVRRWRTPR